MCALNSSKDMEPTAPGQPRKNPDEPDEWLELLERKPEKREAEPEPEPVKRKPEKQEAEPVTMKKHKGFNSVAEYEAYIESLIE